MYKIALRFAFLCSLGNVIESPFLNDVLLQFINDFLSMLSEPKSVLSVLKLAAHSCWSSSLLVTARVLCWLSELSSVNGFTAT